MSAHKTFEKPEVSSIEDLTLKLASAHNDLLKAEQERTLLLANISHDLRAPLTALRSSVDYLMTFQDPSSMPETEYKSILNLMNRRTSTLETLINDLFFLSSLDQKDQIFHFETMDCIPLLEEYYFSLLSDTKYSTRQLELNIPDSITAFVSLDSAKFIRVLDNLYTNALKYSDENAKIILCASCTNDYLFVSIEDTGIGIPTDCIEKIFTRSYTVSNARTPNIHNGSGLGLAITKQILLAHQGSISCKSEVGKGSIFTFKLPLIKS